MEKSNITSFLLVFTLKLFKRFWSQVQKRGAGHKYCHFHVDGAFSELNCLVMGPRFIQASSSILFHGYRKLLEKATLRRKAFVIKARDVFLNMHRKMDLANSALLNTNYMVANIISTISKQKKMGQPIMSFINAISLWQAIRIGTKNVTQAGLLGNLIASQNQ